jgi:hypothetical protein
MAKIIQQALSDFNVEYETTSNLQFSNLYDIFANILLTSHEKRGGFIVQRVDYKSELVYLHVVEQIDHPSPALRRLMQKKLSTIEIDQGLYVTTRDKRDTLRDILVEKQHDDTVLGTLLTYPCYGDIDTNGPKIMIRFYVEPGHKDIFSNVCVPDNIQKFIKITTGMGEFLRQITQGALNYSIGE